MLAGLVILLSISSFAATQPVEEGNETTQPHNVITSFTIRNEFVNVSQLGDYGLNSKIHFFADIPWFLHVRSEKSNRTDDVKMLSVYLYANDDDETNQDWSCDMKWRIELVNRHEKNRSIVEEASFVYHSAQTSWGDLDMIEWDQLIDQQSGFLEDDKLIVEVTVDVKEVTGMKKIETFDFSSPPSFGSDNAVLLIEGKKIYVGKQFLSILSPVFKTMFYGEFTGKGKHLIEIKDVKYEEFIEFLNVVYPSRKPITVDSFRYILRLAQFFEAKLTLDQVESYLMSTKKICPEDKLVIADEFRLKALTKKIVRSYETQEQINGLESLPEFATLSETGKAAVYKRKAELTQERTQNTQ